MNVVYSLLGIDGAMYMLDMMFYVHIVLCARWVCGIVCIWCFVCVGYSLMRIDDVIYMLDMQFYVNVVCILYIWCYVHMMLCA